MKISSLLISLIVGEQLNNISKKSVTGTEADLRKLSKENIHEMLLKLGLGLKIDIEKLHRWEGVKILRDNSSKAAVLGCAGNYKKFARGFKQTGKQKRLFTLNS